MALRPTVIDDRGRRWPLVTASDLIGVQAAARRDAERSRRYEAAARMPNEPVTAGEVARGIAWGLLALPLMLAAALAPSWLTFGASLPWWASILCAIPIGALPAIIVIALTRRVAAQRLARFTARAGYCGSCAFDLVHAQEDVDGCRVCPECGAAWRIPAESLASSQPPTHPTA